MNEHTPQLIALQGAASSLVIELAAGAPLWRYWGPRLADDFHAGTGLHASRPLPSFTLDANPQFTVFPTFGLGWFGQSALLAHRNGRDFAQDFTRCTVTWITTGSAVQLTLHDDVAKIEVMLTLRLDVSSDVLTLSTQLTNRGSEALDVQWLAAGVLPLPADSAQVEYFSGRHNSEFVPQVDALGRGQWRRENRRGLTSHDAFPGAVICLPGATDHAGIAYGAQLAWSGNHTQLIEWLDDGRYQWQFGEWLAPGEVRLAAGETLHSPELLATCSNTGRNGVARNFHAAMRQRITWPNGAMRPRPVHLNTWEGFYFDHDITALKSLADAAAQVGIERFVLDDGWFHRRDDDQRGLGDWWPDARKYPQGLAPLTQHVIKQGMEFGLWVEPEMVNPDSDLYRAHPNWALQLAGRPLLTGRNQLVLDLAQAAVADYLFTQLDALLRELPISYLKWDHNRDLVSAGGVNGHATYHRQIEAVYTLLQRLRSAHPAVEIEACAGGGGRIDAGILRYTHRFWTSDCIDAVSRVSIQRGFLQFFPPEIMGSHIGASPAHSTGRSQSLDFRAAVALPGHLGVELDVRKLNASDRSQLAAWIALYKQLRNSLHTETWFGDAGDSLLWQAHGTAEQFLLLVYRVEPTQQRHMPSIKLPFVDKSIRYQIESVSTTLSDDATLQTYNTLQFDGSWLANAGLPAPPMKGEAAAIFKLRKC